MRKKIILSLVLLDQLAKLFSFVLQKSHLNIPGLTYIKSKGYLFGIFVFIPYNRILVIGLLLISLYIIVLFFRFYWLKFKRTRLSYVSFSFIMGGFLGNGIDCIIFGYVRDMISIPVYISTNLSDLFIGIGLLILAIELLFNKDFRKVGLILKSPKGELESIRPLGSLIVQDFKNVYKRIKCR
ncbi:MAG: signal peptidase II [bacterium]